MTIYQILSLSLGVITVSVLSIELWMIYLSYKADHELRRKKSTIDFVNQITNIYNPLERRLNEKYFDEILVVSNIRAEEAMDVVDILARVEHLSTGVNIGIFDIELVNRMSGSYFLRLFDRLKPYIMDIRAKKGNQSLYVEFEYMAYDLAAIRSKRSNDANLKYAPN